jgi:hypothetical protein
MLTPQKKLLPPKVDPQKLFVFYYYQHPRLSRSPSKVREEERKREEREISLLTVVPTFAMQPVCNAARAGMHFTWTHFKYASLNSLLLTLLSLTYCYLYTVCTPGHYLSLTINASPVILSVIIQHSIPVWRKYWAATLLPTPQ